MVDRADIKRQFETILQQTLVQITPLVENAIDSYLKELEQSMGVTAPKLGWAPLHEGDIKFWHKTGTLKSHLISKITVEKNRIHVVAGIPHGAPGYQEALWNEFGWTPHGTSKVVRRPLFIPLAEMHIRELNEKLQSRFSRMRLNIRIKI